MKYLLFALFISTYSFAQKVTVTKKDGTSISLNISAVSDTQLYSNNTTVNFHHIQSVNFIKDDVTYRNTQLKMARAGIVILINEQQKSFTEEELHGPELTYAQAQDITFTSQIANGTDFDSYGSKDGTVLKVGDKLILGSPSTNTNKFTFIYLGKISLGSALISTPQPCPGSYQAEEVVVDNITVFHAKNSRQSILNIVLYVNNPNFVSTMKNRTIFDYEKAIQLKELVNPNAVMSRDQAIAKLKEAKDLLDLGVISQSKYDSLKSELTPIITSN